MRIDKETSDKLQRLDQSIGVDWISIVRDIGEDPSTFFDNGLWVNVDFSMSDMSQVQFNGATVDGCTFQSGDEDRNGFHFSAVEPSLDIKAALELVTPVSGAAIQSINQRVSSAMDFAEAMKIVIGELDGGGRLNVDTINRVWHKLDHVDGVDLITALMARCKIDGNEDTIIAIAKAKLRFRTRKSSIKINGGLVKIDKKRRRRAEKQIQTMTSKKR